MGPDSVLYRVLDRFSDVAVIAAVTVVCCALVVPGGRAVRASTLVWLTDEPQPIRSFFRGLRRGGGAVTWWWFSMVILHIVAVVEWLAIDHILVRAGLLSGLLVVYSVSVWLVALAALRGLSVAAAFRGALVLCVSQWHRTVAAVAIVALTAVASVGLLPYTLFFGFLGVGIAQYCVTLIAAPPLGGSAGVGEP